MRRLALIFVLLAVVVAVATGIALLDSAFRVGGFFIRNASRRDAEFKAGSLLASVLLVSAFLLERIGRDR